MEEIKRFLPVFLSVLLAVSCAQYGQAPSGGPKDLAPPVLTKAYPAQGTTDFSATEVRLVFDEYVTLQKTDKIITSPPLSKVSFSADLKEVKILLEDSLAADKTYAINFKDALCDLNENTPLRNFTYVFSTGGHIDSGYLSGIVADAFTLLPVKDVSLMFYRERPAEYPPVAAPDYVSVSDEDGFFSVSYMSPGCYYVAATGESFRDYMLDPTEEKLAFSSECWQTQDFHPEVGFSKRSRVKESDERVRADYDTAIRQNKDSAYRAASRLGHKLYLYQDWETDKFLKEVKWEKTGTIDLLWRYRPAEITFAFLPSEEDILSVSRFEQIRNDTVSRSDKKGRKDNRNTIREEDLPDLTWPSRLHYMEVVQDDPLKSCLFFDEYTASDMRLLVGNGTTVDTFELVLPQRLRRSKDTAAFKISLRQSEIQHDEDLVSVLTLPFKEYNFDSAFLYEIRETEEGKDTLCIPLREVETEIMNPQKIKFSHPWKPGSAYMLFFPPACFSDMLDRRIDSTWLRFKTPDLENYGEVALSLKGINAEAAYVLQMTGSGGTVLYERKVKGEGVYEFSFVKPGMVSFVLFEDRNENDRWDAGHYPDNLQPERRWRFPKNIRAEADWRVEETWEISAE